MQESLRLSREAFEELEDLKVENAKALIVYVLWELENHQVILILLRPITTTYFRLFFFFLPSPHYFYDEYDLAI